MDAKRFEIPSTLDECYYSDDIKSAEETKPTEAKEIRTKIAPKRTIPDWLVEEEVQQRNSETDFKLSPKIEKSSNEFKSKIIVNKTNESKSDNKLLFIMNDEDLSDIAKKFKNQSE